MNDLETARALRDDLRQAAAEKMPFRRTILAGAVAAARSAERLGNVVDTHHLAGTLARALADAIETRHQANTEWYSGELLAVLSDIADAGDEEVALEINDAVPGLDRNVTALGCSWVRYRRAIP